MDDRGIERWAQWIASGAGGVGALAGVVLGARWALREAGLADEPALGLAVGLLLGAAGLGSAEVLWSRGQRALGAGLAGTGLGIVYFAVYAGHAWLGLLGGLATGALLLAATGVGVLQAVRRDSELMAVLGLVGGMAAPLALGPGAGAFLVYLALLGAGVAAASLSRGWRILPWLGVAGTLASGASWLLASSPPGLLASVAAAAVGCGWAALAAHPRVAPRDGLPWLVGAAIGLVAALPLLGRGTDPFGAGLVPLLAVTLQSAVLGVAVERHRGDLGTVARVVAAALAVLGLLALGARWALGGIGAGFALALVVAPSVVAQGVSLATGRESSQVLAIRLGGLLGAVLMVALGAGAEAPVAGAIVVCGAWASLATSRTRLAGVAGAVSTLAAALVLALGEPTPGALLSGGAAVLAALAPALVTRRTDAWSWLPALATPALLWPLVLAWRAVAGEGLDGVVPLALGLASAGALSLARTWPAEEAGRRPALAACWALTSLFAVVAVPLQLEAQWLTVTWAVEGAALLLVASRTGSRWMAGLGLALLAAVTVRLTLNPAVLDYHLVKRPHAASWVWYGYGLPALALALAARIRPLPELLERTRPALRAASIAVAFAGANLLVSHGFAGGESLSLLDASDAARVARTLCWAALGAGLLATPARLERASGLVLLGAAALKLAAWDLWVLDLLPGALGLLGVAGCSFLAAGLLGRRAGRPTVVEA